MSLLEFNVYWMTYNICLAVIAVVCGWLALKIKQPYLKIILFALWLLLIPNTLYLLSDIIHFSQQLIKINTSDKIILFLEYLVVVAFGVVSFVVGMYPFEQLTKTAKLLKTPQQKKSAFAIVQFIIAFGIVMGRVERTHSWEVFFDPLKVLHDAFTVIFSPTLMFFVIITGIVGNIVYFLFKPIFIRYVVRKQGI